MSANLRFRSLLWFCIGVKNVQDACERWKPARPVARWRFAVCDHCGRHSFPRTKGVCVLPTSAVEKAVDTPVDNRVNNLTLHEGKLWHNEQQTVPGRLDIKMLRRSMRPFRLLVPRLVRLLHLHVLRLLERYVIDQDGAFCLWLRVLVARKGA